MEGGGAVPDKVESYDRFFEEARVSRRSWKKTKHQRMESIEIYKKLGLPVGYQTSNIANTDSLAYKHSCRQRTWADFLIRGLVRGETIVCDQRVRLFDWHRLVSFSLFQDVDVNGIRNLGIK